MDETGIDLAGPEKVLVGRDGRFAHTLITPWEYNFDEVHHPHDLLMIIGHSFAILEKINYDNVLIHATIIANNNGKRLYLEIFKTYIIVYPADTDHQDTSVELREVFNEINGEISKRKDR